MTSIELNTNQLAIVEAGDESILVIAGPGTGKTTVLQNRIERLLSVDRGAFTKILGITFTTVAASNIRARLQHLPPEEQQRLEVGTFHAFAAKLLTQHGSHLGLSPDYTIISTTEDRSAIVAGILKDLNISTDPRLDLPLLTRLYERGATPDNLKLHLASSARQPYIPELFRQYRDRSIARGEIDFSLLIYLCNELLRSFPGIARQLRKVFPYICVDEFQDTNQSQFKLLELLVGSDKRGLLLLADQDQLIYQWNGASPARLKEARDAFDLRVMVLPTSFRCPSNILSAANRLISHNSIRFMSPEFESHLTYDGSIVLHRFNDERQEAIWVSRHISDASRNDLTKTVVLARARKLLEPVMSACKAIGLPVVMPTPKYEFESAPLIMLRSVLKLAAVSSNEVALERLTAGFYELVGHQLDPVAIRAEAMATSKTPLEMFLIAASQIDHSLEFGELSSLVHSNLVARQDFRPISAAFFKWVERAHDSAATTAYLAAYDDEKKVWVEFERTHRGLESDSVALSSFLHELDLESKTRPLEDCLVLTTVHAAKGLEYDNVYIVGATDDQFPAFQATQLGANSQPMEEERRSFFVAITRCRRNLTVTYPTRARGYSKVPSRFLIEMGLKALEID